MKFNIFVGRGGEQEGKKRLIAARADVGLLTCTSRAFDFMKHQYLKYFFQNILRFRISGILDLLTCSVDLKYYNNLYYILYIFPTFNYLFGFGFSILNLH